MPDYSNVDVMALGVEAACKRAYEEGRKDYSGAAFLRGIECGACATMRGLEAVSTVADVFYNGDNTVLAFADGSRSKVAYDPSYGYAYDAEKAIMAAMLKRLVGNRYVAVLREFAGKAPERPVSCEPVTVCPPTALDDYREAMADCPAAGEPDPAPAPETAPDAAEDGDSAALEGYREDLSYMDDLPDEPGFAGNAFVN